MSKGMLAAAFVAVSCCAIPTHDTPLSLTGLCDSVVCIQASSGNGSGVVIGERYGQTLVLSCAHVAAASQPTVRHRGQCYAAQWLAQTQKPDVAVLTFAPGYTVPPLALADTYTPGQRVLQIGYAHGHLFHSRGEVQHDAWTSNTDFSTGAHTIEGMSGGPVLDAQGRIVGLILSVPERKLLAATPFGMLQLPLPERHIGCVVSSVTIRKWLAEHKIH